MSDQGYEYEQYAPQTGGRLFSSSMFGFNKEEVLEYLDELADENYQRQEAADMQIQDLTQRIHSLEASAASMQQAQPDTTGLVEEARLVEATQQVAHLTEELDIAKAATQQAEEDLAEVREQLFNMQQENNWLREEFSKTDTQIADLRRQLDDASSGQWVDSAETERQLAELRAQLDDALAAAQKAQQEKEAAQAAARAAKTATPSASASAAIIAEANAEADRIRAMANDEKERIRRQIRSSAGGLAESITNLRGELSGVEGDVSRVLEDVQGALAETLSALSRTEQNLTTLGVQVERFPAASAPVPKAAPQQVVYFQPGPSPVAGSTTARHTARRATPAESIGQGSFRRLTPDDSPKKASNVRPFRPAYTSSPAAPAYWAQPVDDYQDDPAEERMRMLAENLVDTLVQMMAEHD